MTERCPECGAKLEIASSCQEIFDSFLVMEFTDPGYGVVHFLTVACFMIQHDRYSEAGRIWIRQQMRVYLEEGLSGEELRQRIGKSAEQSTRGWKVTRSADEPAHPKLDWSMTIEDVAEQFQDAPSYCALIEQWARVTLAEMPES